MVKKSGIHGTCAGVNVGTGRRLTCELVAAHLRKPLWARIQQKQRDDGEDEDRNKMYYYDHKRHRLCYITNSTI